MNFEHSAIEQDLSDVDGAVKVVSKFVPDLIIGGPPCHPKIIVNTHGLLCQIKAKLSVQKACVALRRKKEATFKLSQRAFSS